MSRSQTLGPQSTMAELLELYPWAQRALFRKYHIGGCSSCAFKPDETLEQLCARHQRIDPAEVLEHIQASHEQDARLQIAPEKLAKRIRNGESIHVLDIRTREEWEAVRLSGATRMCQDTLPEILTQWPREELLVIYDHQGRHSLDAATYFQGQGFQHVRCLHGGIDAWSLKVDPSVRRYRLQ